MYKTRGTGEAISTGGHALPPSLNLALWADLESVIN